jgi:hypothetical protein
MQSENHPGAGLRPTLTATAVEPATDRAPESRGAPIGYAPIGIAAVAAAVLYQGSALQAAPRGGSDART